MGRTTGQWRCRICSFERWHIVTVKRKNGALYTTAFYACSRCSVMFLNPEQFSAFGDAAPNVEMPTIISLPARRREGGERRFWKGQFDEEVIRSSKPVSNQHRSEKEYSSRALKGHP